MLMKLIIFITLNAAKGFKMDKSSTAPALHSLAVGAAARSTPTVETPLSSYQYSIHSLNSYRFQAKRN
jgi:hypothetical protein